MSETSETDKKIYLHVAKLITNKSGYIYNNSVLQQLQINDIVRISYEIDFEQIAYWNHDSPYVKIINIVNDKVLGEIQDINRIGNTNNYPLNIGERVWFKLNNIIELLTTAERFNTHITTVHVEVTGPLYTIQSDDSSTNNESDNESDYTSCSESN